jgi:superfamily I DNA/RNA helicase
MLKELIEYIKEGQADRDIYNYLDSKYIHLTDAHYDQIASAISQGELSLKKASDCPAERFFLHFYETILYVNKSTQEQHSVYDVELVQDTNYSIETVDETESKNLAFLSFSINDDYQPTLIKRATTSETVDEQKKQQTMQSVMPVLRGFMSAISD